MNKPTLGPWKTNAPGGFIIRSIKSELARVGYSIGGFSQGAMSNAPGLSEAQANAALIVAAVNACFAINPSSPLAVAEALPELVEALETIHVRTEEYTTAPDKERALEAIEEISRAALAKIEQPR